MLYVSTCPSPLGDLALACHESALVGLWLTREEAEAATCAADVEEKPDAPLLKLAKGWLDAYFAGKRPGSGEIPLDPQGTEFRKQVWQLLCAIPYGEYVTYGELARELARARGKERMCSRAVGGAVGRNPISVIIPCHRVMGAGGRLTGYGGGIDRKVRLLELEGVDTSGFSLPRTGKYAVK